MAEISINGFTGMNNVIERFYAKEGIAEPNVILNSDVNADGSLTIRKGKTLFWTLPGSHSLWAGQYCMLCIAGGILYRNVSGIATNVGTIAGPQSPMSYIDVEGKVYFSNPYQSGCLNLSTNTVASWGVALPPGPMLLTGDGGLPAGTYHVTMTNVTSGELSGNGVITDITLTAEGGIQILNRPSGALVWVTDSDEGIFYLVGETNRIVDIPTVEPLPSFLCSPPPLMENLCYAFGRIWGSVGTEVYYSEPFKPGWFKLTSNKFSFESPVTIIAKVPSGLFIGMKDKTKFLTGTEPDQMTQSDAGAGSVKGTLAYCNNLPDLGSVLGTPEKGFVDVPVWLMEDGIVAGNASGKVYNLTKNKIKMSIPSQGASLYRNLEGVFQVLTSFQTGKSGSGAGFSDTDTLAALTDGKIDVHNEYPGATSSRALISDEVYVEVRRNGVLI